MTVYMTDNMLSTTLVFENPRIYYRQSSDRRISLIQSRSSIRKNFYQSTTVLGVIKLAVYYKP